MKQIINFLESNLVGAQVQQQDLFAYKLVNLDENTTLVCAYGKEKFISGKIAIKHEDANSIPEDVRQWYQSPTISTIIKIAGSGSIETESYDYEQNEREVDLVYLFNDDNVEIEKLNKTTERYEPFGNTTAEAVLEALKQKEYTRIISGDIKSTNKQM